MNLPLPYHIASDASIGRTRSTSVKEANVRDLLRLLRRHSPCSRADLVRFSGLTAPTVSAGISRLQRRGLVTTLGNASSNGGRPPGLLEFNARHGYVVGVDIGGSQVRFAMADLNGTVIGRSNTVLRAERRPKAITDLIATGVTRISQQQKVPLKKILHVAVGSPGITDVSAGRVLSAHSLTDWNDVPLRDLLQEKLRIPTTVENDVNLGALGEGWRGAARNVANFIFLHIGSGVGAGVVVNGMLHHGANWVAGEVGYCVLPGLANDPPAFGVAGPFERVVGGKNIERSWMEESNLSNPAASLSATEIFDLAATGDNKGREMLHRVADQLAMVITNISLVLDLSLVVLGGGAGHHAGLLRAIERRLERNQFARPQLLLSSLKDEAMTYGAIWLALQAAEIEGYRGQTLKPKAESEDALVAAP
jgi:glucokinase